jgi:NAD(P)-dependent dehydrogenase (short-subunit alcohol dehydrogenase family)
MMANGGGRVVNIASIAGAKVSMMLGAKGFLDPLKVRCNGLTGKYR